MKIQNNKNKVKLKEVTTNELAEMVQNGFTKIQEDINEIKETMATKEEVEGIRQTMATREDLGIVGLEVDLIKSVMTTKDELREVDAHIGRMERRFQKVEEIVLQDHRPRIHALENAVGS